MPSSSPAPTPAAFASDTPSSSTAIQDAASSSPDVQSEAFPVLEHPEAEKEPTTETTTRARDISSTSTLQSRLRSASKKFEESNPPTGFMIATGQVAASIPGVADIHTVVAKVEGDDFQHQSRQAAISSVSQSSSPTNQSPKEPGTDPSSPLRIARVGKRPAPITETFEDPTLDRSTSNSTPSMLSRKKSTEKLDAGIQMQRLDSSSKIPDVQGNETTRVASSHAQSEDVRFKTEPFDNGYEFPPKQKWTTTTLVGLKAFWKFFITPFGFLLTVYGLNIVAWGGMLFLLLCNASPAMCRPTCDDIQSPRRIWIEIDSQILNALFCVTGFGLIPWRFRDLCYLLQYRLQHKEVGLRRLAGINRGWFRLQGSQDLPVELGPEDIETGLSTVPENAIPFPVKMIADAPVTGIRAPPTKLWKLDFVIWTMVWNTFLQIVLSFFMWHYNRYERPSWSTGFFVALACIVAAAGGIMSFIEGKHVKAIEGVPVTEEEKAILRNDREAGITHWNNIKGEKPKEKKEKKFGLFRRKGHEVNQIP